MLIFVGLIAVLVAVLVAVLAWSRRGQSSIGRESGDTLYETRSKEGGSTPPYLGGPDNWTYP
jgi:hypothetical protein